jgi:hypothetical protein
MILFITTAVKTSNPTFPITVEQERIREMCEWFSVNKKQIIGGL